MLFQQLFYSDDTFLAIGSAVSRAPNVNKWDAGHTVHTYSTNRMRGCPMNRESAEAVAAKSSAIAHWQMMLRDNVALLAMPGAHHKALLRQAYTLHRGHVIDADDLSDLLELADAALAYAVESLLDIDAND